MDVTAIVKNLKRTKYLSAHIERYHNFQIGVDIIFIAQELLQGNAHMFHLNFCNQVCKFHRYYFGKPNMISFLLY